MSYRNNNNNNNNNSNNYRRSESSSSNQNYNNNNNNSRRSSGGGRGRSQDLSALPLETGIICSLKESFGFIHCAERPEEIFFHYSQVSNCHPDDLQIDTEVEFRVGSSDKDPSKRTAFAVCALEPGTVVWETEDENNQVFQGLVERAIKSDNRGGGGDRDRDSRMQEGSIQVLLPSANEDHVAPTTTSSDGSTEAPKKGPMVRFRPEDILPPPPQPEQQQQRQRSNRLFRGDLIEFRIFLDHRTKQKYARYITLVQSEKERSRAERERKMMESATEEEGMVISLNKGFGFLKSNKRIEHVYFHYSNLILPQDQEHDFELKKGQEMKFLVVTEMVDGKPKCAARKLQCLPQGSVEFHTVVAQGIKGVVLMCPRPPSAGNDRGYADDKNGTISLLEPIVEKDEDGKDITITEVSFEFNDAPGGVYTFKQRGSPINGLWILEGDILLFDVVKELADGSYQAAPTRHTLAVGGEVVEPKAMENPEGENAARIRLAACSLVGRAEGTMHTLKEQGGYGFVEFAERPVDVHFNTYNFIPEELASDLRKQLGYPGDEVRPEIGVGVQFDICAHGVLHVTARNTGGRKRGKAHDRENMKAHRILTLPKSAICLTKVLGTGVKGVIKSTDIQQLYAGSVELDKSVQTMTIEERHPLVSKMIDSFIEESDKPHGRKQLVYRDVLSTKDDEVVVEMVQAKNIRTLKCDHIPVAGVDRNSGRILIKRLAEGDVNSNTDNSSDEEKKKKKKSSAGGTTKTVRFGKVNLSDAFKDDLPPNLGDVVTCNVIQDRRTGNVYLEDLKIVERKKLSQEEIERNIAAQEAKQQESSGLGVVQNVVPKSGFGFIAVLDKKAVRQELLFFSLREKDSKKISFRKGDEVKFSIGVDSKTGKRMATNVEEVPKGTIPCKPSPNACKGIVLLEPSHTSLSDTPLRRKGSSDSASGRWNNTKEDPHKVQARIHERGVVLLLEDKAGTFTKRRLQPSRKRSGSVDTAASGDSHSVEYDSTDDEKSVESGVSSDGDATGAILTHLSYSNGAIAIAGAGSGDGIHTASNPKRGDIVSFTKARKSMKLIDVRVEARKAASFVRGRLQGINVESNGETKKNKGHARFIAATEKEETYNIDLSEIVSCDAALLKEGQQVEGILHDGAIYGVCRTSDLYLESKLGSRNHKERPKLNLAVKKDRRGMIIAQSHMAKGPDGTHGFAEGWTTRASQYSSKE